MGHRVPLARNASDLDKVRHRQAMVNMARPLNDRGDVAGFRPRYMEFELVRFGHVHPSFALPEQSKRSKRKAAAKAAFIERYKRTNGAAFY